MDLEFKYLFPKAEVERYLRERKISEEVATYDSLHDFLANHPAIVSRLEDCWRHESENWEQRTSALSAEELFRHLITNVYVAANLELNPKLPQDKRGTLLPGYGPEELQAITKNCRTIKDFLGWAGSH